MLVKRNKFTVIFIVLSFLVVSLLAGCGAKENTTAPGEQKQSEQKSAKPSEYVIGIAMPTSGLSAQNGIDFVNAYTMAAEDINKAGGVDGVSLKVVSEDTLATAEGGINAFNKLAQVSKAPVIATAWSPVVKAMAPLAVQSNVMLMNVAANSPELSGISPLMLNSYPLATVDVPASATYAYNTLGKRKAAILYINNATGLGASKLYKETFEKLGGQVVAYESVEPNAIDVSTQVAKIKAAKPDVIYMQLLIGETIVATKKIKEMGLTAQLTTYSVATLMDARKATQDAINGVIYPHMIGANQDAIKEFGTKFEKAFGKAPVSLTFSTYSYDAPYILKEAIQYMNKKGLEYNGENLKKAIVEIRTFNLPLNGNMVFDDKGDVKASIEISKIVDWRSIDKDQGLEKFEAK